MATKTIKKTARAVADTQVLFAPRQDGETVEYGGVRFKLRGLTWQEQGRVDSMVAAMVQRVRAEHPDEQPADEDYDFVVENVWRLRLGIINIEATADATPEVAAAVALAQQAAKDIEIGGVKRKVYPLDFFDRIDSRVTSALTTRIWILTNLSKAEDIKLVFTSPQSSG